jgi:regulator of sigma E protease
MFLLVEVVRRGRRVNPRMEGMVHLAGMVMLLALMVFLSVHDVRGILVG